MTEDLYKPVVLAVDDTPENLDVVKGLLVPDYKVLVVNNGAAALKIVERQSPDIVLLDIMMPEMDGYEVCRRLKDNPATASIPVIFLTAKDQTADEAEGFALGAADYILKPVNPPILQARVRTHVALKRSMDEIAAAKQRMQDELNVGRDIQLSMLPTDKPATTEFSVEATMQAAREVGGDFYDFFPIGPTEYAFCVADVSDKGVASALFMSVTKALIKARCREDNSTASVVTWVNDEIAIGNDSCMFITLFIAVLDTVTGQVRYTNAGHNPPYIKRDDGSLECIDARHGPMVGAMGGIVYGEDTLQMARGDSLVLFTDGVTEAMNGGRELYGESRLEALLTEHPRNDVESLIHDVLASVREFADGAEQSDDITLLAFSYEAEPSGAGIERLELRLANDISAIGDVVNRFEQFGELHGVPAGDIMRVNLVFDEILSNIISYGYQDEEHHEIVVAVELTGQRLVVTIEDYGIPFNPFAREAPDTNAAIEDREVGGLGIHLVQQVMDNATYQRRQNANVVIFSKAFEEAPGEAS